MHTLINPKESWTDSVTDLSTNIGSAERVASAVAGGGLLAFGLKQGGVSGALMSVLGGAMLFRGTTGHCHMYAMMGVDTSAGEGKSSPFGKSLFSGKIHVTKSITIDKSPSELYEFWRNFENLPVFMKHLESVANTGEKTSHWKAKAPLGMTAEWDAEVTSDIPNERIGWKSLDGSDIANSGVVQFRPTVNRGTEVTVMMTYESPGGKLGEWVAWLFGEEPGLQVTEDLRRFKRLMETGLIMSIDGQPSGREATPDSARSIAAGGEK